MSSAPITTGVIEQYTRFVKPAFDQFIGPSRRFADVIVPWQNSANAVAIDLITEHIKLKLRQHDLLRIYHNLEVMPGCICIQCAYRGSPSLCAQNHMCFYVHVHTLACCC